MLVSVRFDVVSSFARSCVLVHAHGSKGMILDRMKRDLPPSLIVLQHTNRLQENLGIMCRVLRTHIRCEQHICVCAGIGVGWVSTTHAHEGYFACMQEKQSIDS